MRISFKQAAIALGVLAATGGVSAGVASSGSCQGGDEELAGRYRVSGLLGVGSNIRLKKDGSYAYDLSYGALRQKGEGCWVQNGRTVALLPEGESEISNVQTLSNTDFRGVELQTRDDGALVWDIANTGRKAVYVKR